MGGDIFCSVKVWIDQDLCTGDGLCAEICPEVFIMRDDGLAYVQEGDHIFEVALAVAVGGLLAWWPFGETDPPPSPALIQNAGYSPQCSQLYSAIDITWTESQWTVWEKLKRDLDC